MAIERGLVRVGAGEVLGTSEESDVVSWLFNNDEEVRPLLSR